MPTTHPTAIRYGVAGVIRTADVRHDDIVPVGATADHAAFTLRTDHGLSWRGVANWLGWELPSSAQWAARRHGRTVGREVEVAPAAAMRRRARRRFGLEVEFNAAHGTIARRDITQSLQNQGIAAHLESYNHDVRPHWKMTTDATVSGGELVSPIMDGSPRSLQEVRKVLNTVKANGGTTGRNVGMHVHLDINDFRRADMILLVTNLRAAANTLYAYVPDHRTDGSNYHGATRLADHQWDSLAAYVADGRLSPEFLSRTRETRNYGCPVSRYSAFNFNSVLTYGTVEVRLLGHTLNTVKVRNWISVLSGIFNATKRGVSLHAGTVLAQLVTEGDITQDVADAFTAECARRGRRVA